MRLWLLLLLSPLAASAQTDRVIKMAPLEITPTSVKDIEPEDVAVPFPKVLSGANGEAFVEALDERAKSQGVIKIYINAEGGSTMASFRIVEKMQELRVRFHTKFVCIGDHDVASAAFYVFQHCDIRLALKGTAFLTHEPYQAMQGNRWQLRDAAASMDADANRYANEIAPRIGVSVTFYNAKAKYKDWELTDAEAKQAHWFDSYTNEVPETKPLRKTPKQKFKTLCEVEE